MNQQIHLPYNLPVTLALADPLGDSEHFDFEARQGKFSTTDGRVLVLPESATIALNTVSPRAGESIQITRVWSGRSHDREEWVICLSTEAEKARAAAGEGVAAGQTKEATGEPPTPITRPVRKVERTEQPRLFDTRGTGTYGPAPVRFSTPLHVVRRRPPSSEAIPVNVAVREILAFIDADPNTRNWSDKARQGAASTILIAEYRAKRIGLWEREK